MGLLEGGLINTTFRLGRKAVVQRLHPIFSIEVHEDIEAITRHVAAQGMVTPTLIHTDTGHLAYTDEDGHVWRALTWVEGKTFSRCPNERLAYEAGALMGKWHQAVDGLDYTFAFRRLGVHDTLSHVSALDRTLGELSDHRLFNQVEPVANEILERWRNWSGCVDGPLRICHGDPKLSNLRFTSEGKGLCLLDLDTMGYLSLDVEMGDAWRSWCNEADEDGGTPVFNMDFFRASLRGYVSSRRLTRQEAESLESGVERICLELAARFARDALEESYFGWSDAVAPTRGEHNLLRARNQLELARSVSAQRSAIREALEDVLRA